MVSPKRKSVIIWQIQTKKPWKSDTTELFDRSMIQKYLHSFNIMHVPVLLSETTLTFSVGWSEQNHRWEYVVISLAARFANRGSKFQ